MHFKWVEETDVGLGSHETGLNLYEIDLFYLSV